MQRYSFMLGAGIAVGALTTLAASRRHRFDLKGKTVAITGGSRGLGFLLAREFGSRGARIAILARDKDELSRAAEKLQATGNEVLTIESDITIRQEADRAVQKIHEQFGRVDVLVNNAGIISVGPVETMTIDDYRNSINTHFWGPYFATSAVLPEMQRRRSGRIVNISSIGGKISVPHLVPYSVGKFALTAFSEGLRPELLKDNIYVTTVCPGLMRTGSPRNALFKGNNKAEYAWFSISDALPLFSIGAERAARAIVNACVDGKAEIILSVPAHLAAQVHGLFPGVTADVLSVVNRLLPPAGGIGKETRTGAQSSSKLSPSWVTALNERAARRNNQIA